MCRVSPISSRRNGSLRLPVTSGSRPTMASPRAEFTSVGEVKRSSRFSIRKTIPAPRPNPPRKARTEAMMICL